MSMSSSPRWLLLSISGRSAYSRVEDSVRRESVSSSSPSSSDSSLLIASYCSFGFCVGIFELGVLAASVLDQFSARSVVFGRLDISFGRLFVAGPFVSMLHGAVFLCLFLDLLWTL